MIRQGGFSLIELLVAFVILTLSMTAIYAVLSGGAHSLRLSQDYTRASDWARSRLVQVGVSEPLQEGEQRGSFDADFSWTLRIAREQPEADPWVGPSSLYRLQLQVHWQREGRPRQVQFETLRLAPRERLLGGLR